MIKTKTTLVLGAGASQPYGFPSGDGLVGTIIRSGLTEEHCSECGINYAEWVEFRESLSLSAQQSVDAYLEWHEEFLDVGKQLMAYYLIANENEDALFTRSEDNWYRMLINTKLCQRSFDTFASNQLTVVTFNYDRSFEHYLYVALSHRYGVGDKELSEVLNKMKIIHVHGRMGRLPWQAGNDPIRAYMPDLTLSTIREAAHGMKIVTDKTLDESDEFAAAQLAIEESEWVFFFGFHYHEANVRRLKIPKNEPVLRDQLSRRIRGTVYGFTDAEVKKVESTWPWLSTGNTQWKVDAYMRNDQPFVML